MNKGMNKQEFSWGPGAFSFLCPTPSSSALAQSQAQLGRRLGDSPASTRCFEASPQRVGLGSVPTLLHVWAQARGRDDAATLSAKGIGFPYLLGVSPLWQGLM